MVSISIVVPESSGGVREVANKVYYGFKLDGYKVNMLYINGGFFSSFFKDLLTMKKFQEHDAILYMGSIARSSSIFTRGRKGLFIHGFVKRELLSDLAHKNSLKVRAGALASFIWWNMINMHMAKPDFYVCHSMTACEANNIKRNCVLLPQFVLPNEMRCAEEASDNVKEDMLKVNKELLVVTYTSYASSPRLLSTKHMVYLARSLSKHVLREVKFIVIDPKISVSKSYSFGNVNVIVINPLPKKKFLALLVSADLFIERCIDEELGFVSIEAGLMGLPIAKITNPDYTSRQDYTDKEVILAHSFGSFTTLLADYLNSPHDYKDYYVKNFNNFLRKRRLWNEVKGPLTQAMLR